MTKQKSKFSDIPDWLIDKWQEIADLLAKIINVPSALIMKTEDEYMEVFISSYTENNPYKKGDKEKWYGLYCETVIKSQKKLLVANALNDVEWNDNPDIKLGMISYLGFPINFPDGAPFGTICVLDSKENKYKDEYIKLIIHFRDIIENDLFLLHAFDIKTKGLSKTISDQQNKLIEKNKALTIAKEKTEENERKLKEAQELAKLGNWELDILNNKLHWSDEVYRIFGFNPQEFEATYDKFLNLVHPDDQKMVNDAYLKHLKTQKPYNIIHRILLPGNSIKYINEKCSSKFDQTGKAYVSIGTVADVTENVLAQNALKEAKERAERNEKDLLNVQEIARIGSWYLDIENNQVTWTKELYEMYGFNPDKPVPPYTEHMKLFTSESWEMLSSSLNKTKETGVPYELELRTVKDDGSNGWMWVHGEAVYNPVGKKIGLWGAAQDITERKKIEEELADHKKHLEELVEVRTKELVEKNKELEEFNKLFVGREFRIKELKEKVKDLEEKLQTR